MPRYNVEHNNKWACFSSIVDAFITKFVDKEDYEVWRKEEHELWMKLTNKVAVFEPVEQCNQMDMIKAVFSIRLHNSHEESVKHLVECGLSLEESEKLIYDIETTHWCPTLKENGTFECPNCGSEVKEGQKVCENETCELEFVWR